MKSGSRISRLWKPLRTIGAGIVFIGVVVVLMIWLAGGFKEKIAGSTPEVLPEPAYQGATATVTRVAIPVTEEAVGSVRPVHEMVVTSRVAARITELNLTAGQQVAKDDVLVKLDDRDLQARVAQTTAALDSAKATRDQATIDRERLAQAYAKGAASKSEFDAADLALKNAQANVARAGEMVAENQAALTYATIRAPTSGIVVDKRVNVGDTIMPGQVIATLYDPTHMQLIASVREGLTQRLKVGQTISVRMDALDHTCPGTVSEIVPEAQAASRTFQVKVTGPCPPGIYSGMFGRIIIPLGSQEVLLIPQCAVARVGQLDLVNVVRAAPAGPRLERRIVRLGRQTGDDVEVLSGLTEGERVAIPAAAASPSARPLAAARSTADAAGTGK